MASIRENKVQYVVYGPERDEGSCNPGSHQASPCTDSSEQEDIAQLTRSIQSIVNADKRISFLLKSDREAEHKPTLWLR